MKIRLLFALFLTFFTALSQNQSYVDSLASVLNNYNEDKQLELILNIPYDKFIGDLSAAETLVQKAIELAMTQDNVNALAQAYQLLAQVYTYQDKRDKKVMYNLKAIQIFEEIGQLDRAGYAYCELGFTLKWEDFDTGLLYMRKGINLIEKSGEAYKADAAYDNYGILQSMMNNYDSAIFYHNKSLKMKKANSDSIGIPYGYAHLASVNIQLKNFIVAKKYIDSAHVIRTSRNDTYGVIDDHVYYGDLYFAEKNFEKGIESFKRGFDLSEQHKFFTLKKYCAEYLTKSYESIRDFKNAHYFNKIYQQLKDSTLNVQTNNTVESLKIEFNTSQQEKEILKQREQILQNELVIKNRNLISLLLIASILFVLIISYGIIKRQQHKRREMQTQLELKEAHTFAKLQDQRLRISRDLHDNIGSQLTFIISSIDNLKYNTRASKEVLRTKLTEINEFASGTIAQLRDTIWAMKKSTITIEDFQGRILAFIVKARAATNGINFELITVASNKITFSSVVGMNLFRVVQEAINNSIKYAGTSNIKVRVSETKMKVIINISDTGKGFDLNSVQLGHGLENMQKRCDEINATLDINSEIGTGTEITITCKKNKSIVV